MAQVYQTRFSVGGSFFTLVEKNDWEDKRCDICEHAGRVLSNGESIVCPECAGLGFIPVATKRWVVKSGKVGSILINITKDGPLVRYLTGGERVTSCPEALTFSTYEEAKEASSKLERGEVLETPVDLDLTFKRSSSYGPTFEVDEEVYYLGQSGAEGSAIVSCKPCSGSGRLVLGSKIYCCTTCKGSGTATVTRKRWEVRSGIVKEVQILHAERYEVHFRYSVKPSGEGELINVPQRELYGSRIDAESDVLVKNMELGLQSHTDFRLPVTA